ncbi:MAG: peptidylprolyl isomerase [Phycisphaerales bacterium]|nr:peptidylprolyl isomerase [Phycisphaerales bacterium]
MIKLWSRTRSIASESSPCSFETLEPRVVLDGTPADAANPVVEINTNYGNIYVELFPDVAPLTVENFLGYVNRGDYNGTFFHRHVTDFVLQGGGYKWNEGAQSVAHITQQDPVVNEFNLSNLQWTVAMAKIGGDPDSATSEWFINLKDNAHRIVNGQDVGLDAQNEGFTVFGNVVGGRDAVTAITGLRISNFGGTFTDLPVTESYDGQGDVLNSDLVVINKAELVYDPAVSLVSDTTVIPGGSANGSNLTTVVLPNGLGRTIAFQQQGLSGGWTVSDLGLKSESSGDTGSPVSWIDPKDGKTYAAAVGADGLILYKNTSGTNWSSRNLNDEVSGAGLITHSLTAFISKDGKSYLAGLTAGGKLMLFRQTGASANGDYTWTARNLSDTDLAGQTMPDFSGALSSYVTSWGGLNIVGLDSSGDIQAFWWSPGRDAWAIANLSNSTGAPPLQGSISPYLTSWGAINLTGTDSAGKVIVTWWVPSFGGQWTKSDLTTLKGGPALDPGSVSTYVTPWGGTNIVGRDENGQVAAYWWSPTLGAGQWQITILSQFISGAEIPTGPMVGFSSPSGVVNIFGTADNGDLIRYWWKPNQQWQWANVSSEAVLT